jgi:prepilin-type N-terminal cleavage/methylation domain-containing protein
MSFPPKNLHRVADDGSTASSIAIRAFSLIELLTVVAVLSVLAAASIPALSSLSGASSLTGDGNNLVNLAASAREYSLANNALTALVGVTTLNSKPTANYRAFIVLKREADGTWSPLSKWFLLSDKVSMSNQATNTFLQFRGSYTNVNFPPLTLDGATVNVSTDCTYQFFLPDGRMDASDPILLRLVPANGTSPNRYDLIFNPNTGTVKVDRS